MKPRTLGAILAVAGGSLATAGVLLDSLYWMFIVGMFMLAFGRRMTVSVGQRQVDMVTVGIIAIAMVATALIRQHSLGLLINISMIWLLAAATIFQASRPAERA